MVRLTKAKIQSLLEDWLESEFSFDSMETLAGRIAALAHAEQHFMLDWVKRSATANVQIGRMFATQALNILTQTNHRSVEAWVQHALDEFDRAGLKAALDALRDDRRFASSAPVHAVVYQVHFVPMRGLN
jgi:hypothetical protein